MIQKIRLIFVLVFLFSAATVFSQDPSATNKDLKRKNLKRTAKEQINLLHNDGILLVRLHTRKNAIEALRKQNKTKEAEEMQKRQDILNKAIIRGFKTQYKFSSVLFFYSDYSKQVTEKQWSAVVFVDENLAPDGSVTMNKNEFLTAEFSSMSSEALDGTALVIMDEKFEKLHRPFPFYVTIRSGTPLEKTPEQVIVKLEKKLIKFYNK